MNCKATHDYVSGIQCSNNSVPISPLWQAPFFLTLGQVVYNAITDGVSLISSYFISAPPSLHHGFSVPFLLLSSHPHRRKFPTEDQSLFLERSCSN